VTAAELKLHLKNVMRLIKREHTYKVVLSNQIPGNIILNVKEHTGAHLMSALSPTMDFEIHETNMTAAMWEYVLKIIEDEKIHSQEQVLRQLDAYIRALG
jgi:hypothetical protein